MATAASPDPAERRARVLCAVYALITFLFYVVWDHYLGERSADEGIFENLLWNANHGHGLATWVESGERLLPHLALHFSPVIWLFVWLYRVFPSMHGPHLVLCVCTAIAGWQIFRLARARLDDSTALIVMGAFLLHPTIVLQTFLEFHEQALALLPLVLLVAAYHRGAIGSALVAALFMLSIREDNLFPVVAIGALALVVRRNVRLGVALIALGAFWFVLYRRIAIGWLAQGETAGVFGATYALWGATPGEAVRTMLAEPGRVIRHLLSPTDLSYLAQLLGPFLLVLGFGDPIVLAMVPQLLMILLARHDTRMFQLRLHYSLVPVVLLMVGAIGSLARLRNRTVRSGGRRIPVARWLAGAMLAISVAAAPLWMARTAQRLQLRPEKARAVIALVPDTASVTAPGYLLNQMAQRRRIGLNWIGPLNEYVIVEEPRGRPFEDALIEMRHTPEVAGALRDSGYVEIHARDGWHIWHRPPRR